MATFDDPVNAARLAVLEMRQKILAGENWSEVVIEMELKNLADALAAEMARRDDTSTTRSVLAAALGMPVGEVLHYAVVVRRPGFGLAHRFCGMPGDAVELHGEAVRSLVEYGGPMEEAKRAAGGSPCSIRRTSLGTTSIGGHDGARRHVGPRR